MKRPTDLACHLAQATGLRPERAIQVYQAGRPWPLWSSYVIRKAAVYAFAHGLLLSQALTIAGQENKAEENDMKRLMAKIDRLREGRTRTKYLEALAALPSLKEGMDHVERLSKKVQEPPGTVFRLYQALQQYAEDHPDWTTRQVSLCIPVSQRES